MRRAQDDADALRYDAGLRLAASGSRGTTPLSAETHLASQPTLSRLIALLSTPANRNVLREAITELAGRRFATHAAQSSRGPMANKLR